MQIALITGAGRGIGRATAIALSKLNYTPILVSRTESDLRETRELCGRGEIIVGDVSDPDQVENIIKATIASQGRLDALIHCAGIAPAKTIEDMSIEEFDEVLTTNLSSAFYLAKSAWPHLKQRGGVIVNISSQAARDPFPGFAAYAAAKAGINLLTLALAREGAAHNIRVHAIAPGATETAMFRKLFTPSQFSEDKTMSPADVANVIVQCITGTLKYTDGETIYLQKPY